MKYLRTIYLAVLSAHAQLILLIDRLPGIADFLSVDRAVLGVAALESRLALARDMALKRMDAFDDLSDHYVRLADAAESEADRAAQVIARLSRLLD